MDIPLITVELPTVKAEIDPKQWLSEPTTDLVKSLSETPARLMYVGSLISKVKAAREMKGHEARQEESRRYFELKSGAFAQMYNNQKPTEDSLDKALSEDTRVLAKKRETVNLTATLDALYSLQEALRVKHEALREMAGIFRSDMYANSRQG